MIRLLLGCMVVCVGVLAGCASTPPPPPDTSVVKDHLAVVAEDIHKELRRINAGRRQPVSEPRVTGCTQRLVSIDFDGDVMLFIKDLKASGFCDVRVTGKRPPQELVLSLHHHKVPLWKVLEDAGTQLGNMADVVISPRSILFTFRTD